MLIDYLKNDLLTARKNSDTIAKGCLNPLISDCDAVGKVEQRKPTDDEVIKTIKSFIKRANLALDSYSVDTDAHKTTVKEIEILEGYLPKQLDDVAITFIVGQCVEDGMNNIGQIMKHFKEEYNGQYDAALVSKIVKEELSK